MRPLPRHPTERARWASAASCPAATDDRSAGRQRAALSQANGLRVHLAVAPRREAETTPRERGGRWPPVAAPPIDSRR